MTTRTAALLGAWAIVLGGCAYRYVIPQSLDPQLDRTLTFTSLQADPETHRGRLVPLGGVVLGAGNLKGGTQIGVLHPPRRCYDRRGGLLTHSGGRFLIPRPGYLETAI